jgi:hypothetical protein
MPPANETVQDRIIANVLTTLAAIAGGSTYYTTVARVYEMKGNPLQSPEMPCAIVQHMGLDEKYGSIDTIDCNLRLAVALCMPKDESGHWQQLIRQLAEDAKRALRDDFGRGTFAGMQNAFDTYVEGTEVANEADGFPIALAQINVRIQFRHLFDDPTAAA